MLNLNISDDIELIKGVGPKTKKLLNSCGIFNIIDLLLYLPRDYEKVCFQDSAAELHAGKVTLQCKVIRIERDMRTKSRKVITTVVFDNNNSLIKGKWFNQPYMKDKFNVDEIYTLSGKLQEYNGEKYLNNPSIITSVQTDVNYSNTGVLNRDSYDLVPKYPLKEGLTNSFLIKIISLVLNNVTIQENLPVWLIEKYKFCSLEKAIRVIHKPSSSDLLIEAQKRLKFQELFTYSLKVLMLKFTLANSSNGISFKMSQDLKVIKDKLPFTLTNAQSKAIREILMDQKSTKQMNRLVQGDVGSGKTIVAIISMLNIVKNGFQAALMAPTEILANQHFVETTKILNNFNVNIALLSGSLSAKEKQQIKERLAKGDIDIIIGTHALLEEDVIFNNLGLVVTDEQHRFGVMQRSLLFNKGKNVDILVMTATPIPRTLALCLYGDLDVSIIDELPPGRKKISTHYIEEKARDKAYSFALSEINKGRQVYVVCPLVEENEQLELNSVEKMYQRLTTGSFKDINTAFIHGKMSSKDKESIMAKFKNGETKVLISTTVIEVGINVPNATVMIIENAERFGLSQIHQLRGRVGRGDKESYCILIAKITNETIKRRLEIIKNSNDGFEIAEEDLKIRGGGEFFGFKQHGEDNLILADVVEDVELFKVANYEARRLMSSNDSFDKSIRQEILKTLENSSRFICFN